MDNIIIIKMIVQNQGNQDRNHLQFIPIKYRFRAIYVCFTLCLGHVYNGYCLTMISATSLALIRTKYDVKLDTTIKISLLNGILPLGAMLGVLLVPFANKIANKKWIHLLYFLITVVGCTLTVIQTIQTILIGRFIMGILSATYTITASSYIKETFAIQYRKPIGGSYNAARIFGILLCFAIGYAFASQIQLYFIFFGPAFIALAQLILLYFVPQSPVQLIKSNEIEKAKKTIGYFYDQKDVEKRFMQLSDELNATKRMTVSQSGKRMLKYNYFSAIHLSISRNLCGVTYIVVYARSVLTALKSPYAAVSPIIINAVQLVSGLVGIYMILRFKRKNLLIYSTFFMCILNILIGCADLLDDSTLTLISMTLFMIPCGAGFQSVTTYYSSELVPPQKGKICNLIHYFVSALILFVPPIIVAATQDNKAYPLFFFFAAYLCFSFYSYSFVLHEVQEKKQLPIFIELQNLKYKDKRQALN